MLLPPSSCSLIFWLTPRLPPVLSLILNVWRLCVCLCVRVYSICRQREEGRGTEDGYKSAQKRKPNKTEFFYLLLPAWYEILVRKCPLPNPQYVFQSQKFYLVWVGMGATSNFCQKNHREYRVCKAADDDTNNVHPREEVTRLAVERPRRQ